MSRTKLTVGTRESILARVQTDLALAALNLRFPQLEFDILALKTSGDKILNKALADFGGRGVFVKELEEALLCGKVDFVVHSLKDLPTQMPESLMLAAIPAREDPRDVFLSRSGLGFYELKAGSRVATSSRRRAAQLTALRKDLDFVDIRGNIQTRLRKLDEGECDAMVLAAAGLLRLGLSERICAYFDFEECLPAVGQGALAIECRADDAETVEFLKLINDSESWALCSAERAFLNKLGGGCSVPAGALGLMHPDNSFELKACVISSDGRRKISGSRTFQSSSAEAAGAELADELIARGAREIVDELLLGAAANVSPP